MKTAVIFPGQGAQSAGMGRDLYEREPAARDLFARASRCMGYDMAKLCFEGSEEDLRSSDRAQPAIFTVSMAAWEALRLRCPDFRPAAAAGLSSGEWAALCVAGAVDFEDALRILKDRGRSMQAACESTSGGMLSVIGISREEAAGLAGKYGLEVANLNSPEQTVLAGASERIADAARAAKEAGARRALPLRVAGAFHTSMMQPAAEEMAAIIAQSVLHEPRFPVWSNVTGRPHDGVEEIRRLMVEQITSSVRWVDEVRGMADDGVQRFIECGPGRVLSGLVKRIDKQADLHNIHDADSLAATAGVVAE